MPLEEAARGYQIFEKREEACRKVILVPGMQPGKATSEKAITAQGNSRRTDRGMI